jgi:hypothetical protein
VFIKGVLAIMAADRSAFGTIAQTSKKAARRAAFEFSVTRRP